MKHILLILISPIQYRASWCMNLSEPEKNAKQLALETFSISHFVSVVQLWAIFIENKRDYSCCWRNFIELKLLFLKLYNKQPKVRLRIIREYYKLISKQNRNLMFFHEFWIIMLVSLESQIWQEPFWWGSISACLVWCIIALFSSLENISQISLINEGTGICEKKCKLIGQLTCMFLNHSRT